MPRQPRHSLAPRILARLDQLAALTSVPGEITRLYLTREHRAAVEVVAGWMRAAGLDTSIDDAGTVVGRAQGSAAGAKTLLIGSHIDTVRNAGRFDGCLGVVLAIEAMAELHRLQRRLPYSVEVLAFGDEEGVRFPKTLTGSLAVSGSLTAGHLDSVDAQGTSIRDALIAFGCKPDAIGGIARQGSDLIGYVEVHMEQGPVLEKEGHPVGIVTAIAGASRLVAEIRGKAGHAGTLPMTLRRDALTGASEMALVVERIARDTPGLVATVGRFEVSPGAANVVPGNVTFSLDIRSAVDGTRRRGQRDIERELRAIARRRHLQIKLTETYNEPAAICDPRFIRLLTEAADHLNASNCGLPSGAGHDGLALIHLCPIGMLFVRCKEGISHNPDESVRLEDIEIATRVLLDFLGRVAPNGRTLS